ncbi:MAG: hypothetical protein GXY77_17580 [Fibrobacter sp.]|nr:hypothetical protein [Fibrobacter sp.]
MMMGASLGSGIENSILASRFGPGNFNIPRTAYGRAAMMDMYKPILARGASYPSSDNVNVNELPPELQNNAQRVYRNEIRNYLRNNPAPYDPNCSSCSEVTQYAKFEGGKYKFSHDVGECIQTNGGYQNVTARLRSGSLSSYVDISHTHPGAGGIPTGYQQKGLFTVTHGNSDMSFFNKAYGQSFRGTMHVYDVPNEIFYQFMPSAKNSLILDFRIITQ